jgi:hypothetical protein
MGISDVQETFVGINKVMSDGHEWTTSETRVLIYLSHAGDLLPDASPKLPR